MPELPFNLPSTSTSCLLRLTTFYSFSPQSFYSQVSSPLLRRITVQFPEGAVSDVTQSHFDKFFQGSELVVAGKLQSTGFPTLHSFTTASAVSYTAASGVKGQRAR